MLHFFFGKVCLWERGGRSGDGVIALPNHPSGKKNHQLKGSIAETIELTAYSIGANSFLKSAAITQNSLMVTVKVTNIKVLLLLQTSWLAVGATDHIF